MINYVNITYLYNFAFYHLLEKIIIQLVLFQNTSKLNLNRHKIKALNIGSELCIKIVINFPRAFIQSGMFFAHRLRKDNMIE